MSQGVTPISDLLSQDKRMLKLMVQQETPVICRRRSDRKLKKISFRALFDNNKQFWIDPNGWDYFTTRESADALIALLKALDERKEKHVTGSSDTSHPEQQLANFSREAQEIASMKQSDRTRMVEEHRSTLDKLAMEKPRDREKIAEALTDTTRDAALANRSTLMEALQLGDEAARAYTQELVDSTRAMVKSSTALIDNTIFNDEMISSLVQRSNGTVVQHMTRVFLNGVSFLTYYNNKMLNSSLPNKIRINFESRYKKQYINLLRHLHTDDVTLERVFHTGMQAISEPQLHTFATGFLIHDIGKAKDIEYHEGEAAYDRNIVVDHVRQGYIAVMHKTNYPREAGMITGYHHEYYGSPGGYGFYRALLTKAKQKNPKLVQDYCISYTMEPIIKFNALSYFPAKIMEIVDVFDALTDPNRKYKEPLSPEGAINLMQDQFIDKELKIDPILFDLFIMFVEEAVNKAA